MRSTARFIALLLLLVLVRGVALLCVLPLMEGWDEYQHVAYVDYIARYGKIPKPGEAQVAPELLRAAAAYPQSQWGYEQFWSWGTLTYDQYWARGGRVNVHDGGPVPLYQAQHPPGYYAAVAPVYRLAGGTAQLWRAITWLRCINLLLTMAAVAGFVLAFRQLAGGHGWWRWAAALLAVQPFFLFNGVRVSSDAASLAVAGLVTWLLARLIAMLAGERRRDAWTLCGLGVATGLLAWTKASTLAFMPLVVLAPLFFGGSTSWGRRLVLAAVLALLAGAVSGPYLLPNLRTYGALVPMHETLLNAQQGYGPAAYLQATLQVPWLHELRKWWLGGTFYVGGWSYLPVLPSARRFAYEPLLVLGILSAVRAAWRGDQRLRRGVELALLAGGVLTLAVAVKSVQSLLAWGMAGTNPWYVAAGLPLVLLLVACGFWRLRARWVGGTLLALLGGACVVTEWYGLLVRLPRTYGAADSAWLGLQRLALLHPAGWGTSTLLTALGLAAGLMAAVGWQLARERE